MVKLPDLNVVPARCQGGAEVDDYRQNARGGQFSARYDLRDAHRDTLLYLRLSERIVCFHVEASDRHERIDPCETSSMKTPQSATVLLPTYDVQEAIGPIVAELGIAAYALRNRGIRLDVLVLDGGGHAEAARRAAAERGLALTVIDGPSSGPGQAYAKGLARVAEDGLSDLVITLDANGRHDPTQIPALIERLVEQGADVVIGSRWAPGSGTPGLSFPRWVLGRLANLIFLLVTSTRGTTDGTTSFRVARTEILPALGLDVIPSDTYSIHTRFVAKAVANGFRVGEAPIIYRPPIAGGGGLTIAHVGEFMAHLLSLRTEVRTVRQHRLSPLGRAFRVEQFGAQDDLECLAASKHFFDWVLTDFGPYLHGSVLEVGAGAGTITRKLEKHPGVTSVVSLEPAANMFGSLDAYAALTPRVSAHRATLTEYLRTAPETFDAVLYVNVLEHIADDAAEVRLAASALRPGGALLVFGPAMEALYSELDHKAGHYRRYSTLALREIAEAAGLRVHLLGYFDVLGVLPYLVVYRWLRRPAISGSTVWGYDRLIVPASRLIQRMIGRPPIGKNVLLVALKT
jgi:SAM-dependent methyltransferase